MVVNILKHIESQEARENEFFNLFFMPNGSMIFGLLSWWAWSGKIFVRTPKRQVRDWAYTNFSSWNTQNRGNNPAIVRFEIAFGHYERKPCQKPKVWDDSGFFREIIFHMPNSLKENLAFWGKMKKFGQKASTFLYMPKQQKAQGCMDPTVKKCRKYAPKKRKISACIMIGISKLIKK